MGDTKKKHFIGFILLFVLGVFYFSFSKVVFYFVNESSLLIECLFLIPYICLLLFLAFYFRKNKLTPEKIILLILCFTIANPYFIRLVYYPVFVLFEGSYYLSTVDNFFEVFYYPFDIFYNDIPMVIMILTPLVSLLSFVRTKKKEKLTQ